MNWYLPLPSFLPC